MKLATLVSDVLAHIAEFLDTASLARLTLCGNARLSFRLSHERILRSLSVPREISFASAVSLLGPGIRSIQLDSPIKIDRYHSVDWVLSLPPTLEVVDFDFSLALSIWLRSATPGTPDWTIATDTGYVPLSISTLLPNLHRLRLVGDWFPPIKLHDKTRSPVHGKPRLGRVFWTEFMIQRFFERLPQHLHSLETRIKNPKPASYDRGWGRSSTVPAALPDTEICPSILPRAYYTQLHHLLWDETLTGGLGQLPFFNQLSSLDLRRVSIGGHQLILIPRTVQSLIINHRDVHRVSDRNFHLSCYENLPSGLSTLSLLNCQSDCSNVTLAEITQYLPRSLTDLSIWDLYDAEALNQMSDHLPHLRVFRLLSTWPRYNTLNTLQWLPLRTLELLVLQISAVTEDADLWTTWPFLGEPTDSTFRLLDDLQRDSAPKLEIKLRISDSPSVHELPWKLGGPPNLTKLKIKAIRQVRRDMGYERPWRRANNDIIMKNSNEDLTLPDFVRSLTVTERLESTFFPLAPFRNVTASISLSLASLPPNWSETLQNTDSGVYSRENLVKWCQDNQKTMATTILGRFARNFRSDVALTVQATPLPALPDFVHTIDLPGADLSDDSDEPSFGRLRSLRKVRAEIFSTSWFPPLTSLTSTYFQLDNINDQLSSLVILKISFSEGKTKRSGFISTVWLERLPNLTDLTLASESTNYSCFQYIPTTILKVRLFARRADTPSFDAATAWKEILARKFKIEHFEASHLRIPAKLLKDLPDCLTTICEPQSIPCKPSDLTWIVANLPRNLQVITAADIIRAIRPLIQEVVPRRIHKKDIDASYDTTRRNKPDSNYIPVPHLPDPFSVLEWPSNAKFDALLPLIIEALPTSLTRLELRRFNVSWQNRHLSALPATLTELRLAHCTTHGSVLNFPAALTRLSFHIRPHQRNEHANFFSALPIFLTSLEIKGLKQMTMTHWETLPLHLLSLRLPDVDTRREENVGIHRLPCGKLQTLQVFSIATDQLTSLPAGLTKLVVDPNGWDVVNPSFEQLVPQLAHLRSLRLIRNCSVVGIDLDSIL